MSSARSFERPLCGLPVDHELGSEAVVTSARRNVICNLITTRSTAAIVSISLAYRAVNVIELHTSIGIPPPVEGETETLPDTTIDTLVAKITAG